MAASTLTCKQCKTAMALQPLDPVCGEQGELKVTLIQLPAMVCPNMHRRFAKRDFPLRLLEQVSGKDMETLPAGKTSGLLFKSYHCGTCGGELDKGSSREEIYDFDVVLEDFAPFRVQLTLPVHKCSACGKEQLRSVREIQKLAPAAMAGAFKAAGLNPE